MEARANLEERAYATTNLCEAEGWLRNPGQHCQERTLAGAVATDYADSLSAPYLEGHVAKSPDGVLRLLNASRVTPQQPPYALQPCSDGPGEPVSQRFIAAAPSSPNAVALADPLGADRDVAHLAALISLVRPSAQESAS